MSASSTRVAVAAFVVVLLGLAGVFGWRSMTLPTPAVQPATAEPEASLEATPRAPGSPAAAPVPPANSEAADSVPAPAERPAREIAAADAGKATNDPAAPSFDIVRVEPSGEALLAGRSKPDETVALVASGKVVAQAKADAAGNFVMSPPTLKPGDYALSLRQGQGAAAKASSQSVVVSVPASKTQPVVVVLAEPGKATTLLSAAPAAHAVAQSPVASPAEPATPPSGLAPQAAAPATPPKLAIRSVELENGSGLFASGVAPPGTDVRVYLNNSRVADVAAGTNGAWTFTVRKGLTPGHYEVRADALRPNNEVGDRVEVPFDLPSASEDKVASNEPPPTDKPMDPDGGTGASATVEPARSSSREPLRADAVVDQLDTELVSRGDNLWRISRKRLGHGVRYTEIYAANVTQIRDPKLVYPGQIFVLPRN